MVQFPCLNEHFTIYSRYTPVAEVIIDNGNLTINKFTDNKLKQVFNYDNVTLENVYNFMKSRCYEDGRADLAEILKAAGMEYNNPWEWCRKTHGANYSDFYWIKYEGENLTWEDVKVRD